MPVLAGALDEPDGLRVKSVAVIEDEDSGSCHFHLIVKTTTSNSIASANLINRLLVEIGEFVVVVVCNGLPLCSVITKDQKQSAG